MKKLVLITAGDPNGIGPEITVKALKNPRVQKECHTVVIGEPVSLKRAGWTENLASLIPLDAPALPKKHAPSKEGGLVSYQAVETGIKLALKTGFPLVTAPISKQSWQLCGIPFTGHTELLRARTKQDGLMMFVSGKLSCCLVTEHFALSHLPLTKKRVENTVLHFVKALEQMGQPNARIGLCALNPHASDNGKFGTEEQTILRPALKNLQRKKMLIDGLFPSDDAWLRHQKGLLDGLVCIYHDQALLGLKLAARKPIVHLTAGLPFLRTSPTHGTAFDIAGKNKADPESMIEAILFACKNFKN
jgi:4-hydroxythreonine-4-phosphate dehydrogenase